MEPKLMSDNTPRRTLLEQRAEAGDLPQVSSSLAFIETSVQQWGKKEMRFSKELRCADTQNSTNTVG